MTSSTVKLIIVVPGRVSLNGPKIRDFKYDHKHSLYIWNGREIEIEEFNLISKKVVESNQDLRPYVLAVNSVQPVAVVIPAAIPAVAGHTPEEVSKAVETLVKIDAAVSGWAGANADSLASNVERLVAESAAQAKTIEEFESLASAPAVRHAPKASKVKRKYTRRSAPVGVEQSEAAA